MFDIRRITWFCFEKRLSKHKMTICSKNLGGPWPLWPPPGYAYVVMSALKNFPLKILNFSRLWKTWLLSNAASLLTATRLSATQAVYGLWKMMLWHFKQSRRHAGSLVGFLLLQFPQIEIWNTIYQLSFVNFYNVNPPAQT